MDNLKFNLQMFNDGTAGAGEGNAADTGFANQDNINNGVEAEPTPTRDFKAEFEKLIKGEFKDVYAERTQQMIDKRFKSQKALESRFNEASGVLDLLAERYGTKAGDIQGLVNALDNDTMYLEQYADERGLTVEQAKEMKQLERQAKAFQDFKQQQEREQFINTQFAKWEQEAESVAAIYPDFDFGSECDNQQFMNLLKAGIPVQHAYETMHMDDIKNKLMTSTASVVEEQVTNNIRAKGNRPSENGATPGPGVTTKIDTSKLSLNEMKALAQRAARGEKITFR